MSILGTIFDVTKPISNGEELFHDKMKLSYIIICWSIPATSGNFLVDLLESISH